MKRSYNLEALETRSGGGEVPTLLLGPRDGRRQPGAPSLAKGTRARNLQRPLTRLFSHALLGEPPSAARENSRAPRATAGHKASGRGQASLLGAGHVPWMKPSSVAAWPGDWFRSLGLAGSAPLPP